MAIVEMKKLSLIGLISEKDTIIKTLMSYGVVELIQNSEKRINVHVEKEQGQKLRYLTQEKEKIELALATLVPYDKRKKGMFSEKKSLSQKEIDGISAHKNQTLDKVDYILEKREHIQDALTAVNRETHQINILKAWENYHGDISVMQTKNSVLWLGMIPVDFTVELVREKLTEESALFDIKTLHTDKEFHYIELIFHKSSEAACLKVLREVSGIKLAIKGISGQPKDVISTSVKHIDGLNKKITNYKQELLEYAKSLDEIERVFDYISVECDKLLAISELETTDYTFMVQGWIPVFAEKLLEEVKKNHAIEYSITEAAEDDLVPTLLKNNGFTKQFETITEQYSLPQYGSIDPNLFLSLFFVVFFGMMIGDAGYGVIITLFTGFLIFRKPLEGTVKQLMTLLFYCGLSTIFFGALFGSWWGNLIQLGMHKPDMQIALWFDPVQNPMKLLIICCIVGAVHLLVGLLLKAKYLISKGKPLDALYDVGLWILFLAGIVTLFFPQTAAAGKIMASVGAIGLILTQGRAEKNIVKRLLLGVLSLYGVTGYLSDVLSYSRILALGLATGIIATVINTIATLFGFNFISIILFIIIMIVGHIFNILINTLGAYIHASRLQYIEFFGKFYEGDGKTFQPLVENRKFTKKQS